MAVPRRGRAAIGLPLALGVYLAVAFALFSNVWSHASTQIIGIGDDPMQHIWFISWVPFALGHGQNPFFSDYLQHPAGVNLLWNTSIPLLGLVLWPVTATWGPVVAYNLMITLAPAFSAWAAFLLFRRFVSSSLGAWLGGLLYGFSPYVVAQSLGHPAVSNVYLPPLIMLVLDRIVRGPARRRVPLSIVLGVLGAAQLLVSEEILAATALVGALLLAIAAALYPDQARVQMLQVAPSLGLAAAVFLVLVAYPVGFQLFGPQAVHGGPLQPQGVFVTDLLNFWVPTRMQGIAPAAALRLTERFTGNYSEWDAYLGLPLTALVVLTAVRHWSSGAVRLATLGASLIAILSMGLTVHVGGNVSSHLPVFVLALLYLPFQRHLPARLMVLLAVVGWVLMERAPLFDNVIPARLMVFVYLLSGGLLALFIDRAVAGGGARRLSFAAGAAVVALVPLLPALPYQLARPAVPLFFTGTAVESVPQGSVALVLPMSGYSVAEPMLWQASARMRFRMPDGYVYLPATNSGPFSSQSSVTSATLSAIEVGGAAPPQDPGRLRAIRNELASAGVRTVMVGPQSHFGAEIELITRVVGQPPEHVGGVAVWRNLDLTQT
ncbi:MAG: hypothetical protein J2P44_00650 [Candidatus Dormibacteraeota bacterium]|nr:hypothetical protein [Candidatus Dormibacteraeota bacterium]